MISDEDEECHMDEVDISQFGQGEGKGPPMPTMRTRRVKMVPSACSVAKLKPSQCYHEHNQHHGNKEDWDSTQRPRPDPDF